MAQSAQLIDISGDKMKLLLDFPTIGEPHYAQAIPASLIKDKQVKFYKLAENTQSVGDAVARPTAASRATASSVDIKMIAIRSHFAPDNIEGVQVGDTVYFHVTNIEQDWDILHGFAVLGANTSELILQPGETRTLHVDSEEPRRLSRSTAPTSARRSTRRCRDTSACRRPDRACQADGEREQEGAGPDAAGSGEGTRNQ